MGCGFRLCVCDSFRRASVVTLDKGMHNGYPNVIINITLGIRKLPAVLLGTLTDAVVLTAANIMLKSGKLKSIWNGTKSTQIGVLSGGGTR